MKFKKNFKRLLRNSVVSAVAHIMATKSHSSKVLKILVLIGCLSGFFYHIRIFMKLYWSYSTVMEADIDYPDLIKLPAISVCSANG